MKPQQKAIEVRGRYGIRGIPVPVEKIAKLSGIELRFAPLDDELSGMAFINGKHTVIGVNSLHHPNRQRFTIAHEIGHVEMHKEMLIDKVHVDKTFRVLFRNSASSSGAISQEVEANQFAAELLMPESALTGLIDGREYDIEDDRLVDELAKRFKVSAKAMEHRIRNLNFF